MLKDIKSLQFCWKPCLHFLPFVQLTGSKNQGETGCLDKKSVRAQCNIIQSFQYTNYDTDTCPNINAINKKLVVVVAISYYAVN